MRSNKNLILIVVLAVVAYFVFYKKKGVSNGESNGESSDKPSVGKGDYSLDPSQVFPRSGSGTMDIPKILPRVSFL